MTSPLIITELDPRQHKRIVTVTHGMRGYFAVQMWFNTTDHSEGFWEPWESAPCSFSDEADAWTDAADWAFAEGLPLYQPETNQ